jgi:hypothetical protein
VPEALDLVPQVELDAAEEGERRRRMTTDAEAHDRQRLPFDEPFRMREVRKRFEAPEISSPSSGPSRSSCPMRSRRPCG